MAKMTFAELVRATAALGADYLVAGSFHEPDTDPTAKICDAGTVVALKASGAGALCLEVDHTIGAAIQPVLDSLAATPMPAKRLRTAIGQTRGAIVAEMDKSVMAPPAAMLGNPGYVQARDTRASMLATASVVGRINGLPVHFIDDAEAQVTAVKDYLEQQQGRTLSMQQVFAHLQGLDPAGHEALRQATGWRDDANMTARVTAARAASPGLTLVSVGAGHFAGPHSVSERLAAQGAQVARILVVDTAAGLARKRSEIQAVPIAVYCMETQELAMSDGTPVAALTRDVLNMDDGNNSLLPHLRGAVRAKPLPPPPGGAKP